MMKKTPLFLLLFWMLLCTAAFAQHPAKYWVQFKDKAGSPYSVTRPAELLSPRALELRQRYHIPVDELDIPVNESYIRQVLALDDSMRLLTRSKWLNGITIYSEHEGIQPLIEALPCVDFVERTVRLDKPETDLDTLFRYDAVGDVAHTDLANWQKRHDYEYGRADKQVRMNGIQWLHRMGYRGEGVQMAVLDAGFLKVDTLHFFHNLFDDNRVLGVRNFVQPSRSPFRTGSHGTGVLSCIAACSPGEMVGTAPMAQFYLFQTEDGRSEHKVEEDNWVAGLELADSLGCQIVNSSLGYTEFDDSTQLRTRADLNGRVSRASRAATIAAAKGMIVCNSAGNEGSEKWKYIGCPADAEGILTVGAVGVNGKKAHFSSVGPTADGRVKPDVCTLGYGCYAGNASGRVNFAAGTSYAAPLMAGMVACLWQAFPDKTNYEIMEAVRQSSSQSTEPDSLLGYGLPDFLQAYNMLKQPAPASFSISFDAFDTDTLFFGVVVHQTDDRPQHPRCSLLSADGKGKPKKLTCNPTIGFSTKTGGWENWYYIVLPKCTKKNSYQLSNLEIEYNDTKLLYVIGQEPPARKKK